MSDDPFADTDSFDQTALDEETELRAMGRALEYAEGFKLIFARCNQPDQRRKLIARLRERLPQQNVQEIFFNEPITHLLDELRPRVSEPPPDAVFVSGLEYSLPTAAEAHATPFVANLNASRNSFPQVIPRPLVLWVPEYILNALIIGAPDFFSVRSGVYYFAASPAETAEIAAALTAGSSSAMENLPIEEKQERVEAIKSLLADYEALPSGQRDYDVEMRIILRVGNLLWSIGSLSDAKNYYEKLLNLARKKEDQYYESVALSSLGGMQSDCGENLEAEATLKHSLEIAREIRDRDGEARVLLSLGYMYKNLLSLEDAKNTYEQSLEIFRELGDSTQELRVLTNLANVLGRLDQHEEAKKIYEQSLSLARDSNNLYAEAINLLNLSLVYIREGRLLEAESAQQRSLDILLRVGDIENTWKALNARANLRKLQGDIKGAIEDGRRAVEILEKLKDERNLAWMREKLAELEAAKEESSQQA